MLAPATAALAAFLQAGPLAPAVRLPSKAGSGGSTRSARTSPRPSASGHTGSPPRLHEKAKHYVRGLRELHHRSVGSLNNSPKHMVHFGLIDSPIRTFEEAGDDVADGSTAVRDEARLAPDLRIPRAEHDYVVDDIEGALPGGSSGTLYRNGPGKNEVGGKPYAHLFDGDGLLSQFAFDGKRLHYRNRFVRTTHYLAERAADKPVMRNYGQQRPGGPLAQRVSHARERRQHERPVPRRASCWRSTRAGAPGSSIRTRSRRSASTTTTASWGSSFTYSAHPTWDPARGELYNFGIQYGPAHEAAHLPSRHARAAPPPARDRPALPRRSTTTAR